MTANEISEIWGVICFFGLILSPVILWVVLMKAFGPKIARNHRKRQIEMAINLGMVDAMLQEEVVEEMVAKRLRERRR